MKTFTRHSATQFGILKSRTQRSSFSKKKSEFRPYHIANLAENELHELRTWQITNFTDCEFHRLRTWQITNFTDNEGTPEVLQTVCKARYQWTSLSEQFAICEARYLRSSLSAGFWGYIICAKLRKSFSRERFDTESRWTHLRTSSFWGQPLSGGSIQRKPREIRECFFVTVGMTDWLTQSAPRVQSCRRCTVGYSEQKAIKNTSNHFRSQTRTFGDCLYQAKNFLYLGSPIIDSSIFL